MKIEKNIPMPEKRSSSGKYKDVLRQMEIGDSVSASFNEQAGLRQAAKVLGFRIAARKENKGKFPSKFRIWRIK